LLEEFSTTLINLLKNATLSCSSKILALSGGLDSTILAYFLKERKINVISAITKDFLATDLTYCQIVAKDFNLELNINSIDTEDLLDAIEKTIKILKIFNDIEIRNAVVMYLILTSIKKNGYNSIITGDGADELFAGYDFLINKTENLKEELHRLQNIMHFPAKKIGDSLGIKIESPFLDSEILDFAKTLPTEMLVNKKNGVRFGKWILRKTFENKIPKSISWRKKSPIQEGAGTAKLTDLFDSLILNQIFEDKIKKIKKSDNVVIRSKESLHYYEIYRKFFDAPQNLHHSDNKCPFCQYQIQHNTKFCRMCGSYPI